MKIPNENDLLIRWHGKKCTRWLVTCTDSSNDGYIEVIDIDAKSGDQSDLFLDDLDKYTNSGPIGKLITIYEYHVALIDHEKKIERIPCLTMTEAVIAVRRHVGETLYISEFPTEIVYQSRKMPRIWANIWKTLPGGDRETFTLSELIIIRKKVEELEGE